jgi:UDP-glucose 4-epimerase
MIKSFEEVNDLKVPVVTMERRQGDMPEVYADTTKAEKYLKWKAKYSLKDIMKSAWQWEEKNNISKK